MIARMACTIAVLVVAATAFLGYGPAPAGVNAAGLALCIGATIVWFGWPAGYSYRRASRQRDGERPDLVTIGAATLLKEQAGERDTDEPV